jgi:hypothetical protein
LESLYGKNAYMAKRSYIIAKITYAKTPYSEMLLYAFKIIIFIFIICCFFRS